MIDVNDTVLHLKPVSLKLGKVWEEKLLVCLFHVGVEVECATMNAGINADDSHDFP